MKLFSLTIKSFAVLLFTLTAFAEAPQDSTRAQLAVARNVAARMREKIKTEYTANTTERYQTVLKQIAELVKRIDGESLTAIEIQDLNKAGISTDERRNTAERSAPSQPPKTRDFSKYVWRRNEFGIRKLQEVVIIDIEGEIATVARPMGEFIATDTIRKVPVDSILTGELNANRNDELISKGLFGKISSQPVVVLDIIGNQAIVGNRKGPFIATDTIRQVSIEKLASVQAFANQCRAFPQVEAR